MIGHLRDEGRTILMVTHSLSDVERVCDRVAVLACGRIVQEQELETSAHAPRGPSLREAQRTGGNLKVDSEAHRAGCLPGPHAVLTLGGTRCSALACA